jgi:hypothetical protein
MHTVVPLNDPIEAAFVRALAEGQPPTTAAVIAGRSIGMALHLLQRPGVRSAVRHLARHLGRVVARLDQAPAPQRRRS